MYGRRSILQGCRRVISPAHETAQPGVLVDRHQQRLVNILLSLQVHRRLGPARLEEGLHRERGDLPLQSLKDRRPPG